MDEKLECVKEEHDAHKSQSRWQEVSGTKVLLSIQVEAWEEPDHEESKLQKNNVTIIALIVRDFSRATNSPSYKWISQDQVDEKSWQVPEP